MSRDEVEASVMLVGGTSSFVPHRWLLPRCSVVVHHGGLGTTMACIR